MSNFGQDGFDVPFAGTMKLRFVDLGPRRKRQHRGEDLNYQQYAVYLGRYVVADAHKYADDKWEIWVVGKGAGFASTFSSPEEFAHSLEHGAVA